MPQSTLHAEHVTPLQCNSCILTEVTRIQLNLIRDGNFQRAFEEVLATYLSQTGSAYGFIGDVQRDLDGSPLLKLLNITGLTEDESTLRLFPVTSPLEIARSPLDTLFSSVLTTEELVIANDPLNDARFSRMPDGHPQLRSYLGIPIRAEGELIGIVSLGNRPGGFSVENIAHLELLTTTLTTMLITQRLRSKQRLTEASLTEVDVRNRAMLKALPDMLFVTTRDGQFIDVRSKDQSELYAEPYKFLGKRHRDVLPADICDDWDEAVKRAFETRKAQQIQYSLPTPKGLRWYESRIVSSDDGEVLTIARDITDQTIALKELEETRGKLNLVLGQVPGGLWCLDRNLHFTTAVGRVITELGLEQNQLVGQSLYDFLKDHPRAVRIAEAHQRAIHGETIHRELEFGGRILDCILEPACDATGERTGCIGVAIDVTERRRAERERFESESRWKTVVENVPDFISVLSRDGTIQFLNRVIPGFDLSLVGRNTIFDYQPPEEHERVRSVLNRVFEHGETTSYETIARGRPDEWRHYSIRMVPMRATLHEPLAVMISNDITDQKNAYAERERDYALLKAVFEGTAEIIVAKDTAGRYVLANDAMARALETTIDKIVGRTTADLFPAPFTEEILRDDQLVMSNGQSIIAEREVHLPSGKRTMLITKTPWRDAHNNIIGLIAIWQDITQARKAEETIAQQRTLLTHVSRLSMMGQMVATISHEVAQPLSAITNFSATALLLASRPQPHLDKVLNCLQSISEQAGRAGEVLERIRDFARRAEPRREPIDFVGTIRESLKLMKHELKQRETVVDLKSTEPSLMVLADGVELQQVIVNLVTNACDAMSELPIQERQIAIRCTTDSSKDQVLMEVVDRGSGIDISQREQLFEAFYTSKLRGLGMGLAICRKIMEAHGGTIEATNAPGRGASFRCVLQAYHPSAK